MTPTITTHCANCLDVMPTLRNIPAIITDLPYGRTRLGWDSPIPFAALWAAVESCTVARAPFVTTATLPFAAALILSKLTWFRYEWVWHKHSVTNFGSARYQPLREHELILVFARNPGSTYYPILDPTRLLTYRKHRPRRIYRGSGVAFSSESDTSKINYNVGYPRTILSYPRPSNLLEGYHHPTQKPIDLYRYLVETYSAPGDTILDPCMGSGTTGIAALRAGRHFIGIEKDPAIYATARKRLADELSRLETGIPATRTPEQTP